MSQSSTIDFITTITSEKVFLPPPDLLSDEPPLESDLHRDQIDLLISLLKLWWREKLDFYASGNLTIYYSPRQKKSEDFRGPDFFVVLGTEKKDRPSWVVWHEDGKYPNVIVEILSPSTAGVDKNFKKELYQDTFRTPDYFWFDPVTLELQGFHLVDGTYQAIQSTLEGLLWSQQLELYLGVHERKLRFYTRENQLIPTAEELVEQERIRAQQAEELVEQERIRAQQAEELVEQERIRAQQAEEEIMRLREILKSQGIDSEDS